MQNTICNTQYTMNKRQYAICNTVWWRTAPLADRDFAIVSYWANQLTMSFNCGHVFIFCNVFHFLFDSFFIRLLNQILRFWIPISETKKATGAPLVSGSSGGWGGARIMQGAVVCSTP